MDTVEMEKILTAAEMFKIVGDELREKNAEIERLREALQHMVRWHDQLSSADIAKAKDALEKE